VREIEGAGALLVRPDGVVAWRNKEGTLDVGDAAEKLGRRSVPFSTCRASPRSRGRSNPSHRSRAAHRCSPDKKQRDTIISDTKPANFSSVWADLQDYVAASWTRLLEVAPAGIRPILTEYPIFRSDQSAVGLQAADFSAGFLRRQLIDPFNEQETPDPLWMAKMSEIGIFGKLWERKEMVELAKARPVPDRAGLLVVSRLKSLLNTQA
jgi:hypothetical protein